MNENFHLEIRSLKSWQDKCHQAAYVAGWWKELEDKSISALNIYATKIALIHSEISEALEYLRKGGQDKHLPHRLGIEVELADAIHRIFDLAGALDLDIQGALAEKIEYNSTRLDHKLENRNQIGGKKF